VCNIANQLSALEAARANAGSTCCLLFRYIGKTLKVEKGELEGFVNKSSGLNTWILIFWNKFWHMRNLMPSTRQMLQRRRP
jgi:hypothetical protein